MMMMMMMMMMIMIMMMTLSVTSLKLCDIIVYNIINTINKIINRPNSNNYN